MLHVMGSHKFENATRVGGALMDIDKKLTSPTAVSEVRKDVIFYRLNQRS